MSRVGVCPVPLPEGVMVTAADGVLVVKGSMGELVQACVDGISFDIQDRYVKVLRKEDSKIQKSLHGLYRSLLFNMVRGVSVGFSKEILISGTGYRAELREGILLLNVGYSTQVEYLIPPDIVLVCETPVKVIVSGIDKQRVGQIASDIRSIRVPSVYSDRGLRYSDEVVRRKVGKSGVK